MARLALTPQVLTGTAGLTLAASGTALGANTGVQFTNNGLMFLAVYIGVAGAGTISQKIGRTIQGTSPAPITFAAANSTNYLLGPWSPNDFTQQDGTGLTQIDFSVSTGNSVTLYELIPVQ